MTAAPAPPRTAPDCLAGAETMALPAGAAVFRPGDPCRGFFFLVHGAVRVDLVSETGKSVLLYLFGPGETCALTTSCLFSGEAYAAEARTESASEALFLPRAEFDARLEASADFRRLVFAAFSRRLGEMMARIDAISFRSLDRRLAERILQLAGPDGLAETTHDDLAGDLGSAREAVSRKLARWEETGLVERGRGVVRVLDPSALARLAAGG